MKSMTGFGKYSSVEGQRELTIEMKAVNNRFLDINLRLSKLFSGKEELLRKIIGEKINRGTIDVYMSYEDKTEDEKAIRLDLGLARAYVDASRKLSDQLGIENDLKTSQLLKNSDIVKAETNAAPEELLTKLLTDCAKGAVDALDDMRQKEGVLIKADLKKLGDNIKNNIKKVTDRAPIVVLEYREKLMARVSDALLGVEIDQARIINEVAFFCDKADINEELQRLDSHFKQFDQILDSKVPMGRKLDFLSQEINREINTIGSKSNDTIITACVVEMKNELEKIKEQIRNIE